MAHERSVRPRPSGTSSRRPPVRRGRPSGRVLVFRWTLVLGILAVLVVGLVLGIKALAGAVGGLMEGQAATPTPTATGPYVPVDCTPEDVTMTLGSDANSYVIGHLVTFQVTITHVGTRPCTLDAGNVGREVVVTSGSDRIWSSADCDTVGPRLLLLSPGDVDVSTVEWGTKRSAPECPADLPTPGAGTYQAVVATDQVGSTPVVLTLS